MPLTDMRLTDFVCSNCSKIFLNCGVDLYTGNTFNDAISCLKMCIDVYTRSTYTQVYTVNDFDLCTLRNFEVLYNKKAILFRCIYCRHEFSCRELAWLYSTFFWLLFALLSLVYLFSCR